MSAVERFSNAVMRAAAVWAGLMVLVVLVVCRWQWDDIGLSFAVLFGAGSVGAAAGFLFGVPRWVPRYTDPAAAGMTAQGAVVANSNLSKVSDWLTTIVVGLGIAQFGKVLRGFGWLGDRFAEVFTLPAIPPAGESALGLSEVLTGVLLGFMIMFMWTSTRYLQVTGG